MLIFAHSIFFSDAVSYTGAYFGQGAGEIVLNNVDCLRNEPTLGQCFRSNTHDCTHAQDASVACFPESKLWCWERERQTETDRDKKRQTVSNRETERQADR